MKSILMSIRPQYVAKILNKEKTIEVRKKFPKDFVGWVYIYCMKVPLSKQDWLLDKDNKGNLQDPYGKVIARFWCDKVEEYVNGAKIVCGQPAKLNTYKFILKDTCLTEDELYDYCEDLSFKAIHITKLEIFDKPMSLNLFYYAREPRKDLGLPNSWKQIVTRPPQSWCYIEV